MKRFLKILAVIGAVIVLIIAGGLIYLFTAFPDVDPPKEIKVAVKPERIERGKYIANHVAVCIDCHSERDQTKFSLPIVAGTEGKGGEVFGEEMGFPGNLTVKNITPAALQSWTDGEIIRAITCGVSKDETPLFPMMPYLNYNQMTQEDLYSVVAYIRTLAPIKNEVPPTELNFPLNLIVRTMPLKSYNPAKEPDKSNTVEYGKYLVTLASCMFCHTQSEQGETLPGMEFAGGSEFEMGSLGTVRSANITPHNETGIGMWTKEQFINRFKSYDPDSTTYIPVKQGEFNTTMPWTMFAGMTEEDLGSIYDYLKTIKPVNNKVNRFTPPGKVRK